MRHHLARDSIAWVKSVPNTGHNVTAISWSLAGSIEKDCPRQVFLHCACNCCEWQETYLQWCMSHFICADSSTSTSIVALSYALFLFPPIPFPGRRTAPKERLLQRAAGAVIVTCISLDTWLLRKPISVELSVSVKWCKSSSQNQKKSYTVIPITVRLRI